MTTRTIAKRYAGTPSMDGAGVKLNRIIGHGDVQDIDPFLMLDFFDSRDPEDYVRGFPWHPHRGIETITYLVDGLIEHGDSLGNKGVIGPAGCQWMTAGSGIIHQEMPQPARAYAGRAAVAEPAGGAQDDRTGLPRYHREGPGDL